MAQLLHDHAVTMPRVYDEEEIPLELLRRPRKQRTLEEDSTADDRASMDNVPAFGDRYRSGTSGAIVGFVAGAGALGIFHLMVQAVFVAFVAKTATQRGVPFEAALAIAYLSAGAAGAIVGAMFASVTKYLRRFLPLLIWSVIFFGSVAMMGVAAGRTWAHGPSEPMMRAIFAATGLFAFLMPFSLTIRKRA